MKLSLRKLLLIPIAIGLVLTSCYLYLSYFSVWNAYNVNISTERGNEILLYLYRHKLETGMFPESLDSLEEVYHKKFQNPTAGTKNWIYERSFSGFYLAFRCEGDYPCCYYSEPLNGWYEDS